MVERIIPIAVENLKNGDVVRWVGADNVRVQGAIHEIASHPETDSFTIRIMPVGSASRTAVRGEKIDVVRSE